MVARIVWKKSGRGEDGCSQNNIGMDSGIFWKNPKGSWTK